MCEQTQDAGAGGVGAGVRSGGNRLTGAFGAWVATVVHPEIGRSADWRAAAELAVRDSLQVAALAERSCIEFAADYTQDGRPCADGPLYVVAWRVGEVAARRIMAGQSGAAVSSVLADVQGRANAARGVPGGVREDVGRHWILAAGPSAACKHPMRATVLRSGAMLCGVCGEELASAEELETLRAADTFGSATWAAGPHDGSEGAL